MTSLLLKVAALALCLPSFASGAEIVQSGTFLENNTTPTKAISGIACLDPPGSGPRDCLVAIDEGRFAQAAGITWAKGKLSIAARPSIEIIPDDYDDAQPVGHVPVTACSDGTKKPNEQDSEGITAFDGGYLLSGSHGCGRNNRAARLSSFLLARVEGEQVDLSYRLNEVLAGDGLLQSHFAKDLDRGGISIEGIAAIGSNLYFGLRSPAAGSQAYLLKVPAEPLFAADGDLSAAHLATIDLAGTGPEDMGIRDLAALGADTLLVLIGPATGEGGPYAVAAYKLGGCLGPVTALTTPEGQKAEAILVLDSSDDRADVLVLHDGVKNGGPQVVEIALN